MMKVLVTGATGFIGYHVIHNLLSKHIEVVATSTSMAKAKKQDWFEKVVYIEHDISERSNLLIEKFNSPDAVIHLAWRGLPNYKKPFHIEEELMFQYHFIKQLIYEGLQNITITGTCFEYGMQEGCLNEEINSSKPNNYYSLAKDSLRRFLSLLQQDKTFSMKWLRLFYMYGEGQNENSILPQLQKALEINMEEFNMSAGDQVRDYLRVEEVANYIVLCALQKDEQGIINISSNKPITIIDLVKRYLSEQNRSISLNLGFYPYADYEPFAFWGDNSKLNKIKHQYESNRTI